jgi:hypothetical protein
MTMVLVASLVYPAVRIEAQRAGDSAAVAAAATALDPRISLPSDTGRMIRGHVDFSSYRTPGQCVEAIETMRSVIWRTIEKDTLSYDAAMRDTLPTAAVDAGRACATRFPVEATEPRELRNAMRLALAIGDDHRADAVIERRLALAHGVPERGEILRESVGLYLATRPMRISAAVAALGRLDALGRDARIARLRAHATMLAHWVQRFDRAAIHRETDSIFTIAATMTPDERDEWATEIQAAGITRMRLGLYEDPAGMRSLFTSLAPLLLPLRGGPTHVDERVFNSPQFVQFQMIGHPAPQFRPSYWFGPDSASGYPVPGKVSLLMLVDQDDGQGAYGRYAMIRRLAGRYGERGLSITLVMPTTGFTRWSASPPQEPAEEAQSARWYFLEYLHLPASLAVDSTPFTRKPDGRRVNGRSPFFTLYANAPVVLTDQKGNVIFLGVLGPEAELEAYIRRALGLPEGA